ncbi:MAG: hypothetical protein ABJH05_18515 [Fulvivirga sp.]
MKKLIIIPIMLCFLSLSAQVQQGDSNIGVNLGIMDQNGDEDLLNYSYTYFSLNYQYYASNRVSLGFAPAMTSSKVLNGTFILKTTGLNFYIDYAFLSKSGKTMPYLGAKFIMLNTKTTSGDVIGGAGDFTDFLEGFEDLFGGGSGGTPTPTGADSEFEVKYKRKILALTGGIKFFITERLNVDNNFVFGPIISEKVEYDIFGSSASLDGSAEGSYFQFTVGFSYIIGRRGT